MLDERSVVDTFVDVNDHGKLPTIYWLPNHNQNTVSKKEGKDQESIQSSTTPDPGYQWESDNFTIKHHKRKPRGQPFPSR